MSLKFQIKNWYFLLILINFPKKMDISQENQNLQAEIDTIKSEFLKKVHESEEISDKLSERELEYKKLSNELKTIKNELKITEQTNKDTIQNFENLINTKNEAVLQLEQDLKNTKSELNLLKSKHEREKQELNLTIKELQGKTQIKQQDFEREIQSVTLTKQAENETLIKEYESKIKKLEQGIMLSKNELKNKEMLWKEEIDRLRSALEKSEADTTQLEQMINLERKKKDEEKRELEKQISLLTTKKEGNNEEINFYKRKLDSKSKEFLEAQHRIQDLESTEKSLRKEIDTLKDSLENKQSDQKHEQTIRELHEKIQNLEQDLNKANENQTKQKAEISKLNEENEMLKRKQVVLQSLKSIDLQNVKKPEFITARDSLDELRDDFNRNMQMIEESVIKQKVFFLMKSQSAKKRKMKKE